jgi:hypothetical protein
LHLLTRQIILFPSASERLVILITFLYTNVKTFFLEMRL